MRKTILLGSVGVPIVMAVMVILVISEVVRHVEPCPTTDFDDPPVPSRERGLYVKPRSGCPP